MSGHKTRLTKTSPLDAYIKEIEDAYNLPPEEVGKHILNHLRARHNKPRQFIEYPPSLETKLNTVTSIHEMIRQVWLSMRFGGYNNEGLYSGQFTEPDPSTLEGAIECLRTTAHDPNDFLISIRDAAVDATERYYSRAKMPYHDAWRVYDFMHKLILKKAEEHKTEQKEEEVER